MINKFFKKCGEMPWPAKIVYLVLTPAMIVLMAFASITMINEGIYFGWVLLFILCLTVYFSWFREILDYNSEPEVDVEDLDRSELKQNIKDNLDGIKTLNLYYISEIVKMSAEIDQRDHD